MSKFIFREDTKMLLVRSVMEHSAHLGEHGTLDVLFEKVRDTFIANMCPSTWVTTAKPSVKTLRDKLRTLLKERRAINKVNAAASGIREEISETNELLDDIILEKDEAEEVKRGKREEKSNREEELRAAAETV